MSKCNGLLFLLLLCGFLNSAKAELSRHLQRLQSDFQSYQYQQHAPALFEFKDKTVNVVNDSVVVDMTVKGDIEQMKAQLINLGMTNISQYKHRLSGKLPINMLNRLEQVSSDSWVSSVKAHSRGFQQRKPRSSGHVLNTADQAMFTDLVRKQYNVSGRGVSIGVLSDSYNCLGTAEDDVLTGDLPDDVIVLKDYPDCEEGLTDEGRAMMQLIHDVAPGAKLMFYTAFVSSTDFAQGILSLTEAGANIIVDDVGYLTMPMFQEGPIAQAVNDVTAQGVTYFSAAGNSARMSYENEFVLGVEPLSLDSAHDFGKAAGQASNFYQKITVPAGRSIRLSLQWDDPSEISGGKGAKTDLDIFLLDSSKKRIARSSEETNIGHDPGEFLEIEVPADGDFETTYYLYISHRAGPLPKRIKYIVFSSFSNTGSVPDQLQVVIADGIQFFFTKDNSLMISGEAVVAPFIEGLGYVLERIDNKFLYSVENGHAILNFSNNEYKVGLGGIPIWHVPEGFSATVLPDGRVEIFAEDTEEASAKIEEYVTNSSTIFGHPNASGAIAVGAINYQQTPWFNTAITGSFIESFSSVGGTPILFDQLGNRLSTPKFHNKPEIIAPDGTDTTFFPLGDLSITDFDSNQKPNFFGTSAAAPHAAGMAALLLQAFPQLTPAEVKNAMMKGGLDLYDPNQNLSNDPEITSQPCRYGVTFDWATGCGLIQADLVFEQVDRNTDEIFLTLETSEVNITAGISFEYHFKVMNFSDVDISNVRVRALKFPNYVEFLGIDGCVDVDAQEVSCRLETVAAGETRDVIIYVKPFNNPDGKFTFKADLLTNTNIDLSNTKVNLETSVAHIEGDFNFDGCVDLSDWSLVFAAMRAGGDFHESFDLSQDGYVGLEDLSIIETLYSIPPSGQACR